MAVTIDIDEFIRLSSLHPVIDVRTPAEFEQGHFPGAKNVELFTNVERAIVGTVYKKEGRQPAILKALQFSSPRFKDLIKRVKKHNVNDTFLVHCWRGGMRSGAVAWLLELYGYKVYLLKGGYKTFRRKVLNELDEKRNIIVLGGKTGSGKTFVLHELKKRGEQVIDLEKLAHHKGSSFGSIGESPQPTQEEFENNLFFELLNTDKEKPLWLEDESRMIGNKAVPEKLWNQVREAEIVFLDIPFEVRLKNICSTYGTYPVNQLMEATERIKKRLGDEQCRVAIEHLQKGELEKGIEPSLKYYDKTYLYNLSKREKKKIITIPLEEIDPGKTADILVSRLFRNDVVKKTL
ncbi:MAG: tRNA 2-selenouridine(34) synthase MnmH [Bacteroidota bacterium]